MTTQFKKDMPVIMTVDNKEYKGIIEVIDNSPIPIGVKIKDLIHTSINDIWWFNTDGSGWTNLGMSIRPVEDKVSEKMIKQKNTNIPVQNKDELLAFIAKHFAPVEHLKTVMLQSGEECLILKHNDCVEVTLYSNNGVVSVQLEIKRAFPGVTISYNFNL